MKLTQSKGCVEKRVQKVLKHVGPPLKLNISFHRFIVIYTINVKTEQVAEVAFKPFVVGEIAEIVCVYLLPSTHDLGSHAGLKFSIIESDSSIGV
jgi:hypothetical protein